MYFCKCVCAYKSPCTVRHKVLWLIKILLKARRRNIAERVCCDVTYCYFTAAASSFITSSDGFTLPGSGHSITSQSAGFKMWVRNRSGEISSLIGQKVVVCLRPLFWWVIVSMVTFLPWWSLSIMWTCRSALWVKEKMKTVVSVYWLDEVVHGGFSVTGDVHQPLQMLRPPDRQNHLGICAEMKSGTAAHWFKANKHGWCWARARFSKSCFKH